MTSTGSVPGVRGAAAGRRMGVGLMYGLWRPRVLGAWRVPPSGPAILAVNHSHVVDGPMLMGTAPRPVHFLIKKEAFVGPLGPVPARHRADRGRPRNHRPGGRPATRWACWSAADVLGIFPEGTRGEGDFASLRSGLAYFAVRSGAPVVPVAVLGSNDRPGRLSKALPALRSRIDVVFGDPFEAGDGSGRRTRAGAGRGDRAHPAAADRTTWPTPGGAPRVDRLRSPHRELAGPAARRHSSEPHGDLRRQQTT